MLLAGLSSRGESSSSSSGESAGDAKHLHSPVDVLLRLPLSLPPPPQSWPSYTRGATQAGLPTFEKSDTAMRAVIGPGVASHGYVVQAGVPNALKTTLSNDWPSDSIWSGSLSIE